MARYICNHCNGVTEIEIISESDKATEPDVEFCPRCGMSNEYEKEIVHE